MELGHVVAAPPTGSSSPYFLRSLLLMVVVGDSFLAAALAVLTGWRGGRSFAPGTSAIVVGWLAVQGSIIGYVNRDHEKGTRAGFEGGPCARPGGWLTGIVRCVADCPSSAFLRWHGS